MILDSQLLFSNKQLVAATGDSTNKIDLGSGTGRSMNPRLRAFCQVVDSLAAAETLTSVKAELKGSNDNSTWTTVVDSGTVLKANVAKGVQLWKDVPYLVDEKYRYYKVVFTLAGTVATGVTVTAGLIPDGVPAIELQK